MIEIQIEDDFDLNKIANSGQCFRWKQQEEGSYQIIHREHLLIIHELSDTEYMLSCSEEEYHNIWKGYFDFGEDYRRIRGRIKKEEDPFLYQACQYGKGIRILRQDPWEMLISFIISQNKNIPSIQKSIDLLCKAAGKKTTDSGGKVYYQFPSHQEILSMSDEALASCKLGYRCPYIKAASKAIEDGIISLEQLQLISDKEAIQLLMTIRGVGMKVASCVSLFGLHHMDAFPIDVWMRRILDQEYREGYPMERYRPNNGIYQQYMFFYYRKLKKLDYSGKTALSHHNGSFHC